MHAYTLVINPYTHTQNKLHIEVKACIEAHANPHMNNNMCTVKKQAYIHTGIHASMHTHI